MEKTIFLHETELYKQWMRENGYTWPSHSIEQENMVYDFYRGLHGAQALAPLRRVTVRKKNKSWFGKALDEIKHTPEFKKEEIRLIAEEIVALKKKLRALEKELKVIFKDDKCEARRMKKVKLGRLEKCWRCSKGKIVFPYCVCQRCIDELKRSGYWDDIPVKITGGAILAGE